MNYKDLFDVTVRNDYESITDEVIQKANQEKQYQSRRRLSKNIYGMSAAVAVFAVLALGFAYMLNNNNNNNIIASPFGENKSLPLSADGLETISAETEFSASKLVPYYTGDDFIFPVKEDEIISFNYENTLSGVNIEVLSEETEIFAAADGEVVLSQYDNGAYGHTITIRHNNGMTTLYAHCSELLVNEGDYVEQGQTIAIVGNTGRHLYPLFAPHPYLFFDILTEPQTPANPSNPYNLKILENKFDINFDIVKVCGDAETMWAVAEISGRDRGILLERGMFFHPKSGETSPNSFGSLSNGIVDYNNGKIGFPTHLNDQGLRDIDVTSPDGKFYWLFSVSHTEPFNTPIEWQIDVYAITEPFESAEPIDIPCDFSATFTGYYEPVETFVTEYGDYGMTDNFTLNKIEISDYSLAFEFAYRENSEASGLDFDYYLKFKDGREEVLMLSHKKNLKKSMSESKYVHNGYGYFSVVPGVNSVTKFPMINPDLDITTIEAVIIDGIEFKLNW